MYFFYNVIVTFIFTIPIFENNRQESP